MSDSIFDGRNAERSLGLFLFGFCDIDPKIRQRFIRSPFEVFFKGVKIFIEVCFEHRDGDLVDAGASAVFLDGLECLPHEMAIDPTCQGVKF